MNGLGLSLPWGRRRTAAPPSLATGLWGFWPLDGDLNDASGNARHVTKMGTAPVWVGGLNGLAFTSSDGVPASVSDIIPTSGGLTISAWFLAGPSRPDDEVLFESGVQLVASDGAYGFKRAPRGANPPDPDVTPVRIQLLDDYTYCDPPPHADAGEWVHAVVVYHPAEGVTVYYNGGNAQNVAGGMNPQEGFEFVFDAAFGPICNVGLWTRALSAGEVASLYTTVDPTRTVRKLTDGLTHLYHFDEDRLVDHASGVLTGGNGGNELVYEGEQTSEVGDGIVASGLATTPLASWDGFGSGHANWTVALWFKTLAADSEADGSGVVIEAGAQTLFRLTAAATGPANSEFVFTGPFSGQADPDSWQFVAFTSTSELYRNEGVEDTGPQAAPLSGILSLGYGDFTHPIDGLAIWNRALDASSIAAVRQHALAWRGYLNPPSATRFVLVDILTGNSADFGTATSGGGFLSPTTDLYSYSGSRAFMPPFIELLVEFGVEGDYLGELFVQHSDTGDSGTWEPLGDTPYSIVPGPTVTHRVWLETAKLKRFVRAGFDTDEDSSLPSGEFRAGVSWAW